MWLEQFLSLQHPVERVADKLMRANALTGAGNLAWNQGDYEPSATLLEESLGLVGEVLPDFVERPALLDLGEERVGEALRRRLVAHDSHVVLMLVAIPRVPAQLVVGVASAQCETRGSRGLHRT